MPLLEDYAGFRLAIVLAASSALMILGSCDRLLPTPAAACTAPETLSTIQNALTQDGIKGGYQSFEAKDVRGAFTELWRSGSLKISLSRLLSVNKDTKVVDCAANLDLTLDPQQQRIFDRIQSGKAGLLLHLALASSPGELEEVMPEFDGSHATFPIQYTRQPSADGTTFVYTQSVSKQAQRALHFVSSLKLFAEGEASGGADASDEIGKLAPAAPAADAPTSATPSAFPTIKVPQPYSSARPLILAMGWKALSYERGGEKDPCDTMQDICRRFPEVVSCAGTGLNPCKLAFIAPDGRFIVGQIEGEDPDTMTLTGLVWANEDDSQYLKSLLKG